MMGTLEKSSLREGIFEVQLYAEEMKYLLSVMPKAYTLVKSSKLARPKVPSKKYSDTNGTDLEDFGAEARRTSRNTKSFKEYSGELASLGQKGNKAHIETMKKCEQVLNQLCSHRSSDPFLEPVNPIAQGLHDYTSIVKDPMDLGTIRKKLKGKEYLKISQFVADVRKVFSNSCLYNQKASQVYLMTLEMSEYFEKLNREVLENTVAGSEDLNKINDEIRDAMLKGKAFVPKTSILGATNQKITYENFDKPMTLDEKKNLCQMIKNLKPEHYRGVLEIVQPAGSSFHKSPIIFDIDQLPAATARHLEQFTVQRLSRQAARVGLGKRDERKPQKPLLLRNPGVASTTNQREPYRDTGHSVDASKKGHAEPYTANGRDSSEGGSQDSSGSSKSSSFMGSFGLVTRDSDDEFD